VSELLTDLDWWAATRYPDIDEDWGPAIGRHAYDEDAALTPIFHALRRGGRRSRPHEPAVAARPADPVDQFRRDPLTAPIPVQAFAPAQPGRRRREQPETGRHHRTRDPGRRW
jgi:hypothetical protein